MGERIDTLRISDPAHPWSGWWFKTHHRLRAYLRIPPLLSAVKFHYARISPVPFALNQAEDSQICSAGLLGEAASPAGKLRAFGKKRDTQKPMMVSP